MRNYLSYLNVVDSLVETSSVHIDNGAEARNVSTLAPGSIAYPSYRPLLMLFTFSNHYQGEKRELVFLATFNSMKYQRERSDSVDIPVLELHASQYP